MATVEVTAGICGFQARLVCTVDDAYQGCVTGDCDCPRVRELVARLGEVAVLEELGQRFATSRVYAAAGEARLHLACPVASAILKGLEVAAGLALPAEATIRVAR